MLFDIPDKQSGFPYYLAGDGAQRLFNHRAWISWRYLALLELPSRSLCDLPVLSKDLQDLIESTRRDAETNAANAIEITQILFKFFDDDEDCGKASWLRRALRVTQQTENSLVKKQLEKAVEDAWTVLKSMKQASTRCYACVALFLHLQDCHHTATLGTWHSFLVQERSAKTMKGTSMLKRYVASDKLGDDVNSPLFQFPQCCAHLSQDLDPNLHPVATPPVLCWLCGAGFLSQQALYRHTLVAHGDYAEYRKHLFWFAQKQGFLPMLPWQKRHMLANLSFFQCFSVPNSGAMEWTKDGNIQKAEPRQEVGCAICARKDWIEHRFQVYLFREPEKEAQEPDQDELIQSEPDEETGRQELHPRTRNDGSYCLGDAEAVNKLLATNRYAQLMPSIPEEELYASSIQHPRRPEMIWLLHTRRVPCLSAADAQNLGSTVTADSRCAGIGDINQTAYCCKACINALCRFDAKQIAMPPPALANLLWLGREHPLAQKASLGTRLLSCLGRPVWRKLILGKGDKDEQQQGITGNSILLAQARPDHVAASLPPPTEQLQDTFVVLFSRSIEEVKKSKMLIVHRQDFIDLVRTRQRVCTAYADIPLDEERVQHMPENDVPNDILACAQHLPETEKVNITQVGPASRPVDVAFSAHDAAKVDAEQKNDDDADEMLPLLTMMR